MNFIRLFLSGIIYISGLFYLIASVDHYIFKSIFNTYPDFVIICILSLGNIFAGAMGCIYRPFDNEDVKCYIKTKRTFLFITGVYNCIITIMFMKLYIFLPTFFVFLFSFIETYFDKQLLNRQNNQQLNNHENTNDNVNSNQKPVILVNNLGDIEIGIPVKK